MTEIQFRSDMGVEYIQHMGSDDTQVRAAKASTGDDQAPINEKRRNGLIRYLMNERHTSPSEHEYVSVRVEVPLFVRSEWHRHRTMSYSEMSMRFAEAAPSFYVVPDHRPVVNEGSGAHPKLVTGTPEQTSFAQESARRSAEFCWGEYRAQLDAGIAEEVARGVLPVETYTAFWATANLNNWFKFLDLRNGEVGAPQWEIVQAAQQVEAIIAELYPVAYKAWKRNRRLQIILRRFLPQAEKIYQEEFGNE